MEELQYSIIYALIRPEIDERISVGIIFCQDEKIDVRYSNAKLRAVKGLLSSVEYCSLRKLLVSLAVSNALASVSQIDYLSRYSNNLLSVSERRTVRMSGSLSKDKLYKLYVYDSSRRW